MKSRVLVPVLSITIGCLLAANLGGCPFLTPPTTDPNQTTDPNDTDPNDAPPATTKTLHEKIFTDILTGGFTSTTDCMSCHADEALNLLETGHWTWEGTSVNIEGFENGTHGKMDLINNFCIAVPANQGRCSQCHPSYGWKYNTDASTFFDDIDNVDCLVCHDTTGTYRKHPSANGGGGPASLVMDGEVTVAEPSQLQDVAYNVGTPSRSNCGLCHYFAGGGDNVKHGDLSTDLNTATYDMDVHMGSTATGGLNFSCQQCHTVEDHGIAGMPLHSVDEGGASPDCTRCHGATNVHQENRSVASLLNLHLDRVACQTCHIPTFARSMATKVEWYWSEAGEDRTDIPEQEGRATYDKKKGRFVWQKSVQPAYRWYDGKWSRKMIGTNDTYTEAGTTADPVIIAAPTADPNTPDAKIYPFKKMIGDQPADTTNKRLIVPHLFAKDADDPDFDDPFWGSFDWAKALEEGAKYNNQPFDAASWDPASGFVNTVMYLTVNHEIAPPTQALQCSDCHGNADFWTEVGIADPLD